MANLEKLVKINNVVNAEIYIDTPEWLEWLAGRNSFRYEGISTNFTCIKRKNAKWYATKKIYASSGSKAVSLYIGSDCTLDKLQELNHYFSLEWSDFWQWYYSAERQTKKEKVVQTASECTTDQLQVLKAELEYIKIDRDNLLIKLGNAKIQANSDAQLRIEQLEQQVTKLDNYNWELEKRLITCDQIALNHQRKNAELLTENEALKAELEKLRSSAIGKELPKTHSWAINDTIKPRNWLKMRFKLSDRQLRQANITASDGSIWRRLSENQEREFAKRLNERPNTAFYICVG
jgi:hypothetical protein